MHDAAALVGRAFGEFVIREPLSAGGFGMVFRAEQPALEREAVIKVLHARFLLSDTAVRRFLREARLASRLDHPYAAHTYAFGAEPDGVLWIAMELVRGTPLDRLLEAQGSIPLDRFVSLLERICEVVHTAHEQGIVHRDLKPGNVMVLSRAGRLLPKLLDFGIAKFGSSASGASAESAPGPPDGTPAPPPPSSIASLASLSDAQLDAGGATEPGAHDETMEGATPLDLARVVRISTGTTSRSDDSSLRLTHVGATMGSPLYMAPEQWSDAGAVDARTDIYALGVLCYESLTGRPPFNAPSPAELAYKHAKLPPPPLGEGFPPALDKVIARALAKDPAARYPTALELSLAFRTASGIASEATPLPRIDAPLRTAALAGAPRPLAAAVEALDAARNAHQARDSLWQMVRVAARLIGVTALAAHSHVQANPRQTGPGISDALRELRGRALSDAGWLELARELTRPFAALREAHPVPDLVEFLHGRSSQALDQLIALHGEAGEAGGLTEEQVRELLERAVPIAVRLLEQLSFFYDYPLAVATDGGADEWMGVRRGPRPRAIARGGTDIPAGRPILLDAGGAPVVSLWPFVQLVEPAPGAAATLFFLEGKGRRGARLVALPDAFETEDDELWEHIGSIIGETSDETGERAAEEACPFPGLAAFSAADAGRFFGRERETDAFLNRLRVTPLLAVVGPSGAGKSSFVQAGVLPALPEGWSALTVRPGPAPLVSLASRLEAAGVLDERLRDELGTHPGALGSALRSYAAARRGTVVLVVDQLEEVFTLCGDAAERLLFVDVLARAGRSAEDPVRIVFTLRDDFLLRAEALAPLRLRLGQALQLLTTPAEAELRRILVEPLRLAGYDFDDPALPDEMVEEVAGAPGALALLSFTASKLWDLRDRRFHQIGHRAYRSLGGVGGALAQHAETTLTGMHPEEQRLVREVFRHAVTAEGTRAVLTRAELSQVLGDSEHSAAVVEKLLAARLMVVSDTESGGERVEVTHEALLDAWPRLVTWRREDAEGARLRDQLRAGARHWDERGRPSGLLWRGDALAEYRLWRERYPGTLTTGEEQFAAASLADAARGRRRTRALVGGAFAVLLAFAVVLLFLALRIAGQRSAAEAARARSVESERDAKKNAADLHDLLLSQYESQGRRLLLADDPLQALAYLARAAELGASGFAHDFLVTQAVRASDGKILSVHHDTLVSRARFSPDGRRIATASNDSTARVWDAATGALQHRLDHKGSVRVVAFSPDGASLVTASADGTAVVWDAATGKRRVVIDPARGALANATFSPGGAEVAIVSEDGEVSLWDPVTGVRAAELLAGTGQRSETRAPVRFSPDGALIAAADGVGVVRVWDVKSRRSIARLAGHKASVRLIEFSPDGRRLSTAGEDGTGVLWDPRSGRKLRTLAHGRQVNAVVFSPDGRQVLTVSNDLNAIVWDADTGQERLVLRGHAGGITGGLFGPDGKWIATASEDGTAILWDAATGRELAHWRGHQEPIRDLSADRAGERLLTASEGGRVIVWRVEPQVRITRLVGHTGPVYRIVFASDGAHVATASEDGTARVWDGLTGRELHILRGHAGPVYSARFNPAGDRIATAGYDGTVRLWDAASGTQQKVLRGHTRLAREIAWTPDGRSFTSVGDDGTARVWSAGGDALRTIEVNHGLVFWIAHAPGDDAVATAGNDNHVRIFRASDGGKLADHDDRAGMWTIEYDRKGTRLLGATTGQSVVVLDAATGTRVLDLIGHIGAAESAEWGAGDRLIITAGRDGTVRLWDATAGQQLQVIAAGGKLWAAAFSPDGSRFALAGDDGVPQIWTMPTPVTPDELARVIRCRVPYEVKGDRVVSRALPGNCTAQ
jgi:WD40 repeat protein/serine/threonine protein kinase